MTPQEALRPIRRSPLEQVHAALGARWVDDSARWPASYGDTDAESAVAARTAGIADLGPIDKVIVRGPRAQEALRAVGITLDAGSVSAADGEEAGLQAWCLADDEVVLLAPSPMGDLAVRLRAAGAAGAAVTDLRSGLSVLRLVGPASAAIMERACAVDLSPRALADRHVVQAPVAGVRMIVARHDHGEAPGYTLLVARDLAEYLWGALLDLGGDLGLKPVGGAVARSGFIGSAPASAKRP